MKKLLYTTTAVVCSALLIAVLWAPAAPAAANGKDETTEPALAYSLEVFGEEAPLTCSITCSNGDTATKTVGTRGGCLDACEDFCEETCHLVN